MTTSAPVVGRFAPSPTGPLHFGSLVAACGSWLFARAFGGRWLVRMEDLDLLRVVPGAAAQILEALQRYGLESDDEVIYQSRRTTSYEDALHQLRSTGDAYDCACSRSDIARAASAPLPRPASADTQIYPGTCRNGLPSGRTARAVRFRVPDDVSSEVSWLDLVHGRQSEQVAATCGDFVIRRADGLFAYQLAVVVDDEAQGVTQIVRGNDLASSTARQILLQQRLGFSTPLYAHLPLIVDATGAKLGKREGSLPLPLLDRITVERTLSLALQALGIRTDAQSPERMLITALRAFDPGAIPRHPLALDNDVLTPLSL